MLILETYDPTLGNVRGLIDDLNELDDLSRRAGDLAREAAGLMQDACFAPTRDALEAFRDALNDITHDTLDSQRALHRQALDALPDTLTERA